MLIVAAATVFGILVIDSGTSAFAQSSSAPKKAQSAQVAHSHGTATLKAAVDGNLLTLNFESPLDNLVGFEHAPRTDKQKAAVRRMAGQLLNAASVFAPTPAADCVVTSVNLESPVIDPLVLRGDGAKDKAPEKRSAPLPAKGAAHSDAGGHAEIEGTFVFRCAKAESLRDLEVRLFDRFSGLKRLDVQVATPKGQKSARLSPGTRRVSW
ncbi:MAG: DUF2796 domain-containing protein [Betaproteobacteria bacterium]|nr:DUF2796 domain-containing protein [Betaproteobacteria bacterium]